MHNTRCMCKQAYHIKFEVLTMVFLKTWVFWDIMLCHWASRSQYCKGSQCSHHQCQAVHEESFEMSATFCQMTQQHIPEYLRFEHTRCLYQHITFCLFLPSVLPIRKFWDTNLKKAKFFRFYNLAYMILLMHRT